MSNNPITFTPGPTASTVETPDDTVLHLKREAQNARIEAALEKNRVLPGTIVKAQDGTQYRATGKDGRTLVRVGAKFTKAERKRFKRSRHAMRALTASLDDGVVDRLPPMPRADHVDPQAVCFEPSTLSLSPGNCGFAPGHEGPHSWEQG